MAEHVLDSSIKYMIKVFDRDRKEAKLLVCFHGSFPTHIFRYVKNSQRQLFISECLTKKRAHILFELRKLRDEPESLIKSVGSRNGRPGNKMENSNQMVFVETTARLQFTKKNFAKHTRASLAGSRTPLLPAPDALTRNDVNGASMANVSPMGPTNIHEDPSAESTQRDVADSG